MFAAQPHWYKPVPQVKRKYGVAFFGGYYGNQFSERTKCNMMFYTHFQDVGWLFMIDFGIKKITVVIQMIYMYIVDHQFL